MKKSRPPEGHRPSTPAATDLGRRSGSLMMLESRIAFDAAALPTLDATLDQRTHDAAHADAGHRDHHGDGHDRLIQALAANVAGPDIHHEAPRGHEIAFIDSSVADISTLLKGIGHNVEIVMIDTTKDGIDQMAATLAGRHDISAIHIVSHGSEASLSLGTANLDAESMQGRYAGDLAAIGAALTERADILIYGCDFAKGADGAAAAKLLADLTHADVAASTDATGAERLGGNWVLEDRTGRIETHAIGEHGSEAGWDNLLTAPTLDLDSSSAGVNYTTTLTNTSDAVRLVGFGGAIADADANLTTLRIVTSGIANGSSESLNIAGQKFTFGTARTATSSFGGQGSYSFDTVYDGANTFTITRTGGGSWLNTGEQNTFLRGIVYSNSSIAATGTRTFTFTGTDATAATATATSTVTISLANTAPLIGAPSGAATGEVAAYAFSNGSGNAPSQVTGGPSLTVANGATYAASASRTGSGYGLLFPGGTGNTPMASLSALPGDIVAQGAMTVSGWIRFDTTAAWTRFIDFSTGTDANNNIWIGRDASTSNLSLQVFNGTASQGVIEVPSVITNGSWMQITATFAANGETALYVNGTLAGKTILAAQPNLAALNAIRFGTSAFAGDAVLTGAIDDIHFYNRALNAAEVQTLYGSQGGSMPHNVTVLESSNYVFSSTAGNAITIGDATAGSGNETTTLTVGTGTLTLGSTAGVTVTGNGTGTVTVTGTINATNTALNGLTYTPPTLWLGNTTLAISVNDNGNTGTPGALTTTDSIAIEVSSFTNSLAVDLGSHTAVSATAASWVPQTSFNSAVISSVANESFGSGLGYSILSGSTLISGASATSLAQALLGNDYVEETFTTAASMAADTVLTVAGVGQYASNPYTMTTLISSDNFATSTVLLRDFSPVSTGAYTFNAPNLPDFKLVAGKTYQIRNYVYNATGGAFKWDDFAIATATEGSTTSATFAEGGAVVPITTGPTIEQVATGNLTGATIVLTNAKTGDALTITGALPTGISSNIDSSIAGKITVTLSGSASLANYQTALTQLRFGNSGTNIDTTTRTVTVKVTDGIYTSNTATNTITVVSAHGAPAVDLNGQTAGSDAIYWDLEANTISNTTIVKSANTPTTTLWGSGLTATNHSPADSWDVTGATSLSAVAAIEANAYLEHSFQVNGTAGANYALTGFGQTCDAASGRAALYISSDGFKTAQLLADFSLAGAGSRLNLDVPDMQLTAGVTYTIREYIYGATGTVRVDGMYLQMADDASGNAVTVTSAAPRVAIASGTIIEDADSTTLSSAKIVLTNAVSGDELVVLGSLPTGISTATDTSVAGKITLTLSGSASLASYQTAIGQVRFDTTSSDRTTRTVDVTAMDGVSTSAIATASVAFNVTTVNHAPAGADKTITTSEDTAYVLAAADFGFSDTSDSPANALSTVKIATLPASGSLTLNGVAVTAGQSVTAADITAGKLSWTPATDVNGTGLSSFTFQVQDDGGRYNGGADTDTTPNTITFNVTSVNDAPTGADKTVTAIEDTAYVFRNADFGFADAKDSPANALSAVKIATLPGSGSLTLSGVAVTAGQSVAASDIAAGNLCWTPAANANGTGLSSFTFKVKDDGGTANGGRDTDTTARTITFDVTSINDAPTGADSTVTADQDTNYVFSITDFGFSDPNDTPANAFDGIRVAALPTGGTVTLSGVAVSVGDLVSAADIAAGNLVYSPASGASGSGIDSFAFQVRDDGGSGDGGYAMPFNANVITFDVTAAPGSTQPPLEVAAPNGAPPAVVGGISLDLGGQVDGTPAVTWDYEYFNVDEPGVIDAGTTVRTLTYGTGITVDVFSDHDSWSIFGATGVTPEAAVAANAYVERSFTVNGTAGQDLTLTAIRQWNDAFSGRFAVYISSDDFQTARLLADYSAEGDHGYGRWNNYDTPDIQLQAGATYKIREYVYGDTYGEVRLDAMQIVVANDATGLETTIGNNDVNVRVATNVAIEDLGSASMTGATATLTNAKAGDSLFVAGTLPGGISATVDTSVTGKITVTLSGAASAADYQTAIGQLRFGNSGSQFDTTARTVTVTVTDGTATSNQAVSTIRIGNVEGKPSLNIHPDAWPGDVLTWDYEQNGALDATVINVGQSPTAPVWGPGLTAEPYFANDSWLINGAAYATAQDAIAADAYVEHVFQVNDNPGSNYILAGLGQWLDSNTGRAAIYISSDGFATSRLLTDISLYNDTGWRFDLNTPDMKLTPGTTYTVREYIYGAGTPARLDQIWVRVIDDPNGLVTQVLQNAMDTQVAVSPSIEDPDSLTMAGATLVLTDAHAGDTLSVSGSLPAGITATVDSSVAGKVTLKLSGEASAADYQTAIAQVHFSNPGSAPSTATRHVSITVNDGTTSSDPVISTIEVIQTSPATANHAPTGADHTATVSENGSYTIASADFGFADADDSPSNAFAGVKFVTLPANGSLTVNGVAVVEGHSVSIADIDAGKLVWTPDAGATGTGLGSFTFEVQDDGGIDNNGFDTDATARTFAFDVIAVNHAPTGADATITTLEDTAHVLATADFGFTDGNDSPANALSAVKIVTLPANGSLKLNGVAVTAGQSVSAADIAAGKLVWTPAANANGSGLGSFTFKVVDDGGTANGGVDTDTTARTITFTVTSINDAPSGTNRAIAMLQDGTHALTTAEFGFTDAADTPANVLSSVTITTLPANGSLTLNGIAVTAGQSISAADIAAGKLVWTPVAGANGAGLGSFTFQVKDDGGTANGGADTDATPNTITFTVAAAPRIDLDSATAGANYAATLTNTADSVRLVGFGGLLSDADANIRTLTIVASGIADGGSEVLNVAGQIFTFGTARTAFASFGGSGGYVFQVVYDGASTFTITRSGGTSFYNAGEQNAFLRGISYANSAAGASGTRTFTFTATDANSVTATAVSTVTINQINTAPLIGAPHGVAAGEVASYSFENGTGNAPSGVAGGPTLTVANTVTYANSASRTGLGYGLNFPGGTSAATPLVSLSTLPSDIVTNNAMTVSGWIRFDTSASWQRFIDFSTNTGGNNNIMIGREGANSNLVLQVFNGTVSQGVIGVPSAITNGTWMQLTATFAADGEVALYVNGTLAGKTILGALPNYAAMNKLRFGTSAFVGDAALTGAIDDVHLFSRALDAAEVQALYGSLGGTMPQSVSIFSDHAYTFSTAKGNAITIGDATAGSGTETVTLNAAHGTLMLGSQTGLTVTGSGTATVTFTGTISAINAGLNGLTFTPGSGFVGQTALDILVNDNGHSGTPGPMTATHSIAITVTDFSNSLSVDLGGNSTGSGDGVTWAPQVTIAGSGIFSAAPQLGGAGLTYAAGASSASLSGVDKTSFDQALASDEYLQQTFTTAAGLAADTVISRIDFGQNALNAYTVTTLISSDNFASSTVLVRDFTPTSSSGLTINAKDIPDFQLQAGTTYQVRNYIYNAGGNPVIWDDFVLATAQDPTATTATYTGASPVAIAAHPVLEQAASGSLAGTTVVLTNARTGDSLTLSGSLPAGITAATDTSVAGRITLTLSGSASLADYQLALGQVCFATTSSNFTDRTVEVTTTDGTLRSNTATSTVSVLAAASLNHAPTGADHTATLAEDGSYTIASADFGFVDSGDAPANTLSAVKVVTLPANGSLTLNGVAVTAGQSISAADIAAGKLVWTPAANASGAGLASFTFEVQDDGGTANGGADTDTTARTFTFDVTSVNDAPSGAAHTAITGKDTAYALATSDFGFTDVSDTPANALSAVTIVTLPASGTLTLNGAAVTPGQSVSAADIAAGKLVWTPDAGATGTGLASFTFKVQDDGGTASGGVDTDTTARTFTFDVASPNHAPTGANATITTQENTGHVFATSEFGFSDAADTPANALSAVNIVTLPARGTLTLNGVTVTAGQAVSAADITAGKLVWTPDALANGTGLASFTFKVQDDGGTASGGVDTDTTARTVTFNVTADPRNTVTYVMIGTNVAAAQTGLLSSVGTATLDRLAIVLSNPGGGDEFILIGGLPGGISASTSNAGGKITVTLTGTASIATYETALSHYFFRNMASSSVGYQRTVGLIATSGATSTLIKANAIEVISAFGTPSGTYHGVLSGTDAVSWGYEASAVLDTTIVEPTGTVLTTAWGSGVTAVANGAADRWIVSGATTANANAAVQGRAYLQHTFQVTANAGTGMTYVLNGINQKLDTATGRAAVYISADGFKNAVKIADFALNGTGIRTDVPTTDYVLTPGTTYTVREYFYGGTGTIEIDALGLTIASDSTTRSVSVLNANASINIAPNLIVEDADSANPSAAVIVLENAKAGDTLAVNGTLPAGISATVVTSVPGKITLRLLGASSFANYTTALQQLQFRNAGIGFDTTTRNITYTIGDGVTASKFTSTINIIDVNANHAPSGADHTATTAENTAYALATADFGFTDPNDTTPDALSAVIIVTLPATGTLTLNDLAVTAGQSIAAADIAAGNLVWTPAAGANGSGLASFTFKVQDDGGTAYNGVDTDTTARTFTFDVTSVNGAPTGADSTIAVGQGNSHAFTAADFGFADSSDTPANALSAVIVETLPANGALTLNGVAVTAGQSVSAADIAAGKLTWTPDAQSHGTGAASFTFKVQDDGGTANGGVDTDTTARTVTFDVSAPVLGPFSTTPVPATADVPMTVTATDGLLSNVPGVSGPGLVLSSIAGQPVVDGQTILLPSGAKLTVNANGSYSYDPNGAFNSLGHTQTGTDTFSYTVTAPDGTTTLVVATIDIAGVDDPLVLTGLSGSPVPTTPGSFTATAGDLPAVVSINGTAVTGVGQVIPGTNGYLTIDAYDPATGIVDYSYTLTTPADPLAGPVNDDFLVTVTDVDGDQVSGTLAIDVVDGVPHLAADSDQAVNAAGTPASTAYGNVLTGSGSGAGGSDPGASDGSADSLGPNAGLAHITGVVAGTGYTAGTASQVGQPLAGLHGTLVLNPDGSYAYAPDLTDPAVTALGPGQSLTDTFTYEVTLADGTKATTTLTVSVLGTPALIDAGLTVPAAPDGSVSGGLFELVVPLGVVDLSIDGTSIPLADLTASGTTPVTVDTTKGQLVISGYDPATGLVSYTYGFGHPGTLTTGPAVDTIAIATTDTSGHVATATLSIDIPSGAIGGSLIPVLTTPVPATADVPMTVTATDGLLSNVPGVSGPGLVLSSVEGQPVVDGQTILLPSGAKLTVNANGSYSYDPNGVFNSLGHTQTGTDTFSYTVTAPDGTTTLVVATIDIAGVDDPLVLTGLSGSPVPTTPGSFTATAGDLPAAVSINGTTVTGTGQVIPGTNGYLTIDAYDPATGIVDYSYTLTAPADPSAGPVNDDFLVTVTDVDGDQVSGTLAIAVPHAGPLRDSVPPAIPTVQWADTDGDGKPEVSGTSEPGAVITVTWPDGTVSHVTADRNGNWTVESLAVQAAGTATVTATDSGGNVSGMVRLALSGAAINDAPVSTPSVSAPAPSIASLALPAPGIDVLNDITVGNASGVVSGMGSWTGTREILRQVLNGFDSLGGLQPVSGGPQGSGPLMTPPSLDAFETISFFTGGLRLDMPTLTPTPSFGVAATPSDGRIYVDLSNGNLSNEVVDFQVLGPNGEPLPDTVRLTGDRSMVIDRLVAGKGIDVSIRAQLASGEVIVERVHIDADGNITRQAPEMKAELQKRLFSKQLASLAPGAEDGTDSVPMDLETLLRALSP